MTDKLTNFDIIKNIVIEFQNRTGKEIYLSKFKFGYFNGALDHADPAQYDRIIAEINDELTKLSQGENHAY